MNILKQKPLYLLAFVCLFLLSSCKDNEGVIFSIRDDVQLGQQVSAQVDSTYRANGQLLERNSSNANIQKAYTHLDRILNRVLNSGQVKYRNEFPWSVKIINDRDNLNAFATPGGYIYVYSGLIGFLENEDHFAGVLAHEIAHADKRHSVQQLQREYGIAILLSVVLGNDAGTLQQIAGQLAGTLAGLRFSRSAETDADNTSVLYLSGTDQYACDGAAGFFVRLTQESQSGNIPEFLSTHPNPDNRVENIQQQAQNRNCHTAASPNTDFLELKRALSF